MLKKYVYISIIFLLSYVSIHAQNNFSAGNLLYSKNAFSFENTKTYLKENNNIYQLFFSKEEQKLLRLNDYYKNKSSLIEQSTVLRNNAVSTWTNTYLTGVWTETQTLHLSYIGNPYIYKSFWLRMVNNNTGEKCFEDNKCFNTTEEGFTRLYPKLYHSKAAKNLTVGAKSNQSITIDDVRLTDKTTEVTLTFINFKSGNLNPPAHNNSYIISSSDGLKNYKLLSQFGWNSTLEDGFGYKASTSKSFSIILFFEKMDEFDFKKGFNLKEGQCESGCWNFYDIKFK